MRDLTQGFKHPPPPKTFLFTATPNGYGIGFPFKIRSKWQSGLDWDSGNFALP